MTVTVVFAEPDDKYIYCFGSNSQAAMDGSGTIVEDVGIFAGGLFSGGTYFYIEAFLRFNTTAIGADVVSNVDLSLRPAVDNSAVDVTLEAREFQWDGLPGAGHFRTTAQLAALPLVADWNTANFSSTTYTPWNSKPAFNGAIDGTGYTGLVLHYDGQATGTPVTGEAYANLGTARGAGTTTDPKLTITHAPGITPAAILL